MLLSIVKRASAVKDGSPFAIFTVATMVWTPVAFSSVLVCNGTTLLPPAAFWSVTRVKQ
jgi:hypothetical protein